MKTLLVLRHAKSSWKHTERSDHDRPLNTRGLRDAPRVASFIDGSGLSPDCILSSTATRARHTAEAVASRCMCEDALTLDRRLYLADPPAIIDVVQSLGGEAGRVLVVGHNPGMANLVSCLTGQAEEFPTAALAEIQLPITAWPDLRESTPGQLVTLWRPKDQ